MRDERFKQTMTLGDAEKITGPVAFNIMLKPAGSLCNLDCSYCYYLDKSEIYGGREPRMDEEMLETVVREYIKANDVPEVTFCWHGGEPLVLGMNFYRKALEFQKKYGEGKTIFNNIQTNGTLLTPEWAKFFKDNNFLLGISLDGPEDVHDRYRKDKGGKPTFARVMHGLEILQTYGVEFNTMSTINKECEGRGAEIYNFLKGVGSRYMQFMPVLEHVKYPIGKSGKPDRSRRPYIVDPHEDGASLAIWSIGSRAFGKFMNDIFDVWVTRDVGNIYVVEFESVLANWCGVPPGVCIFAQTCGGNSVIEHNGDLYPCDHFVYPKYLVGNIQTDDLRTMMQSPAQLRFGIDKRNSLPIDCRRCKWLSLCNGECPKHRFSRTESGETGLNALCEGYKMFFEHTAPYMEYMREMLLAGKAPALVMPWAWSRISQKNNI